MGVLVDVAISFGFSLLSNALRPRKTDTSKDSLPTIQFGETLQKAWGTVNVPGTLMFAGEPSLNNPVPIDGKNSSTPEELASYAVFLHTNPNAPVLRAVRVNGQIVATNLAAVPLTKEIKTAPVTDPGTGLTKYQQITFRFYNGTQTTPDPMIVKNGHPYLVYLLQCYLVVADSLRSVFGGRGATVGCVIQDYITSSISINGGIKGAGDTWATLEYTLGGAGIASGLAAVNKTKITVPRGYQDVLRIVRFEFPSSLINLNPNTSLIVRGTGVETVFAKDGSVPFVTVLEAGYGDAPAGDPGQFNTILFAPGNLTVVSTDRLVIGKIGAELREWFLPASATSPFYNVGINVFDSANVQVGTIPAGEDVYGWNGDIYYDSVPAVNVTPNNDPPLGVTDLTSIISGLLSPTGLEAAYYQNFTVPIIGFVTSNKDITTDISNLLAITNRIVFQRRDGVIAFAPYPSLPGTLIQIRAVDHVVEPEIKIEPYESIPDALDFSYLDIDREFDSSSVRVGGDSPRLESFNVNVVATRSQALRYANNLLNRAKRQIISGTLTLPPEYNILEGGDVVLLKALNPSGEDLLILLLRVETGANLHVKAEFVNYAPIDENVSVVPNNAGLGGSPVGGNNDRVFVLDTEARSSKVGLGYFTNSTSLVRRGATTENPAVTSMSGAVLAIGISSMRVEVKGVPIVGQPYYILDSNTGAGSWFVASVVTLVGPEVYELTMTQGLYGSSTFVDNRPGLVVFQTTEESVINDNYASLAMVQDNVIYDHLFTTRKRLVEPQTSGILQSTAGLRVYRRSNWPDLDDDNLSLGTYVTRYFNVRNITTATDYFVASSNGVIDVVGFVGTITNQIEIIQYTDSTYLTVVTGRLPDTYTLP